MDVSESLSTGRPPTVIPLSATTTARVVVPVCRVQTHKHADVVDMKWLPRCVRLLRKAQTRDSYHSTQQHDESVDESECLLAVIFANDPFVYVYDAETASSRPMLTLEHADGRTHGGSSASLLYMRSRSVSDRCVRHQVLTGSNRSGCIRLWNLIPSSSGGSGSNSVKRSVWAIPADPQGASGHLGSVVSLHQVCVADLGPYCGDSRQKERKAQHSIRNGNDRMSNVYMSDLMGTMSLDPYAIRSRTEEISSMAGWSAEQRGNSHCSYSLLVSVTSRGILCVWDTAEERCRENVPAFGSSSACHPINLCRLDLLRVLNADENSDCSDSVVSVSYQGRGDGCPMHDEKAFVKFASNSIVCVDLGAMPCRVQYIHRVRTGRVIVGSTESPVDEPPRCRARELCVLPVGCAPQGAQVGQ